jgi:hypothetical protein
VVLAAVLVAALALAGVAVAQNAAVESGLTELLSPEIPADVDPAERAKLLAQGQLQLAHRLFEKQQWQAFIAINWPVDKGGRPLPALTSEGPPRWATWIEAYQVFRPNGAEPDAWDGATRSLPHVDKLQMPMASATSGSPMPEIDSRSARVLHNLSSTQKVNVLDEVNQAFSFAVWDQNGHPLHYEILINKEQYDYIVANGLYHAGGLADYLKARGKVTFPAGRFGTQTKGAIELKLAWKILDPEKDDFGRYLTQPAYVPSGPSGSAWAPVTAGLVGFHIAQKTETSPQWIWSTFEHVDNVAVDLLAKVKTFAGRETTLRPSFNDPDCEWCPVNVAAAPGADGKRRTQVKRLTPIPPATQMLNANMRERLAGAGSKLQYYEMSGTQWPTDPAAPAQRGASFPGAVANMAGGKPMPVYLVNSVMETFSQLGNVAAKDYPGAMTTSNRMVFGNGSCMGCHSGSPYDFSWIMTKAQPRPTSPR